MSDSTTKSVMIIGAGLVGCVCASYMAKRGYNVRLYEYRDDIRLLKFPSGKSINLALSNRGRLALREIEVEEDILKDAIPMKGRFIHNVSGETKSIPYDSQKKQFIYSVSRNTLNKFLITKAESYPNLQFFFGHKLVKANLEEGNVLIENIKTKETTIETADLIIGADGAFSGLRKAMLQLPLFNYNQTYIEHGYIELTIREENSHLLTPNHLHIWPRGEFMMIALPNQDKTWTVTLFMPFKRFQKIEDEEKLFEFFQNHLPDALKLIGHDNLINQFFNTKPSPLIAVKCSPYHYKGKFLIIGDAAHAMVPFYGQGMNAGFEDCYIFNQILTTLNDDFKLAIEKFTELRVEDAHTICDLAMYNYVEMRDLVTKFSYYWRKRLDDTLFECFPNFWIPLYNSVTFSYLGYKKCIENRKWQNRVLIKTFSIIVIIFFSLLYLIFK